MQLKQDGMIGPSPRSQWQAFKEWVGGAQDLRRHHLGGCGRRPRKEIRFNQGSNGEDGGEMHVREIKKVDFVHFRDQLVFELREKEVFSMTLLISDQGGCTFTRRGKTGRVSLDEKTSRPAVRHLSFK